MMAEAGREWMSGQRGPACAVRLGFFSRSGSSLRRRQLQEVVSDTDQAPFSRDLLQPSQEELSESASLLASRFDPGVSGYAVAVAVDSVTGCPSRPV